MYLKLNLNTESSKWQPDNILSCIPENNEIKEEMFIKVLNKKIIRLAYRVIRSTELFSVVQKKVRKKFILK